MKTVALPSVLSPSVVVMGLLAAAVLVVLLTGVKVPLLSNLRISLVVVVVLGMAMCASGIGRMAAANQWGHPLSIVGYLLGALILIVAAAAFFGLKLPFIVGDRQALVTIGILIAAKVLNSIVHSLITRG
jgi:nucleoside recognition membrane protein YjiH